MISQQSTFQLSRPRRTHRPDLMIILAAAIGVVMLGLAAFGAH